MQDSVRVSESTVQTEGQERSLPVDDILDILRLILRVEPLDELLQKTVDTIAGAFSVKRVSLGVLDEKTGLFCPRAMHGYPPEKVVAIKKHAYTLERMKNDLRPDFRIGRSAYYARAEDQTTSYDDETDYIVNLDLVDAPRRSQTEWHELDYIDFVMTDRLGNWIGWIEIDEPYERLVPSKATIDRIQILSDLAAIAVENAKTYEDAVSAMRDSQSYLDLIVHDIGNMVSPLMYYLESADIAESSEEKRAEQLRNAIGVGTTMRALVDNVRKFSEMKVSEFLPQQAVYLGPVLRECAHQLKRTFPEREIAVKLECDDDASPVLADDLIHDLFMNILNNAVKYTPGPKADIDVKVIEGYSAMTVAIEDRGRGIPDSSKPQVFNRFAKRPEGVQGTGLGLSIVALLVDRYKGLVSVRDRVIGDCTQGTCIEVSLPKAAGTDPTRDFDRPPTVSTRKA